MGTLESIENAKLLVEYNIMCLREVEQLQIEKQRLDDELRAAEMGIHQTRYQSLISNTCFFTCVWTPFSDGLVKALQYNAYVGNCCEKMLTAKSCIPFMVYGVES